MGLGEHIINGNPDLVRFFGESNLEHVRTEGKKNAEILLHLAETRSGWAS
jgi:hypothetical protein